MVLSDNQFVVIRGNSLFSLCHAVYFRKLISFIKDNEYDRVCFLYSLH